MTEAEWVACDDPGEMFRLVHPTERKLRLLAVACVNAIDYLARDVRSSIELAEQLADGAVTAAEARDRCPTFRPYSAGVTSGLLLSNDIGKSIEWLAAIPFNEGASHGLLISWVYHDSRRQRGHDMPRRIRFEVEPGEKVLDRLAGLTHFIPDALIQQAADRARVPDHPDTVLTSEVMLWVVLAMGVLTGLPIRQVFKHARRLRQGEPSPPRNTLCVARQRLGVAPLRHLFDHLARPLAAAGTPGASYKGLRLMALDSTVLDLPDSADNARVFGKPKGGRSESAFPQVRKLSLVELGAHAELAFVLKPCRRGEAVMVPPLLRHLRPGMLLLGDRGFFGYPLWRSLSRRGVDALGRAGSHLVLKPVEVLADGSYLAKVYPSPKHRERDREGIVARVIKYTLDDPQRAGHSQGHTLVTTLLDAGEHPAEGLIVLYHERWEEELTFDEQKTHQDPRRAEKPAHLRSQTPAGVVQEVYALSLGHYVTRALMSEAAASVAVDPDRLSFLGCLQILRCRLPECPAGGAGGVGRWWEAVRWEMAQERLPPRRDRVNPRVVKRKMSKFKKKRAAHRGPPPLRKSFAQAIVLIR